MIKAPHMSAAPGIDPVRALALAERTAREAGDFIQSARSRIAQAQLTLKQPGDLASEIDREAEALIRSRLLSAWPDAGFMGEESSPDTATGNGPCWVVDPIDGTANYLRGYPQYAVSIALLSGREPVAGVVLDPNRNELFTAARGHGAWLGTTRLACAAARPPIEALAATVFPKPASPRWPSYLGEFARIAQTFAGVRRSGAMTLELACLAAGRIDAFWAHDMGPWDAAAAVLLLREAGACLETLDHRHWTDSRSLMACTPTLREPLLALLQPGVPA